MKKLLLTSALFLLLVATSFAGGNKEQTKLFKELSAALSTATQNTYKTTNVLKATSFMYNGKVIHALYDVNDGNLLGFSIAMEAGELPAGALTNIQQRYRGWEIQEATMFISDNSSINYFVLVAKAKKPTLVLKLNATGRSFIYARM